MPDQNIQCTNAPSESVTCSTVKSKRVNSDVNVIRKNTVNVVPYRGKKNLGKVTNFRR